MAVPYKLNYFEIESGLGTTSTFLHKGDLTANRIIKIGGTSNDILLGDGSTGSLSGKQNTITLTTSGTSGAATLIGATLNIPQYTDQYVGTVTSVGLTSATSGVTIGNSPITSSGNITLAIATASGSQNGLLSSTDWTAFNNKQGVITLTTTGSSGAATLIGNTLNIPNYSPDLTGYVTLGTTQTITGAKTFQATATFNVVNNPSINAVNGDNLAISAQSSTASAIQAISNSGRGIKAESTSNIAADFASSSGVGLSVTSLSNTIANFYGASFALKASISQAGDITGNSFIKTGGLSTQFLKADGSVDSNTYGTGTVTSVAALTLGTTGTDLSSTVANSTTTPVITLNVPTASATNRGVLSSSDWSTFNSKQGAITLTTTGTTGAATLIGNTLNIPQYTDIYLGTVTSVGLTMPSAFSVANSPITSSGTLAVTANGLASQYIRGDGTLADFPTGGGGGGSSVSYYLNGSVSQGTIGGNTYYEMNKTPVLGAGTDFNIGSDGYIAQFLTDANDPNVLLIPGGNFNLEFYFSASSSGGTPSYYVELYKYNGSTFSLIASSSATPELIAFGTTINPYFSSLAVPETVLLATDRLAIRIYVNTSGRTITLHTENSHLCQIITTFTTGLQSLNGLSEQAQYFAVGSSGTDFNIASSVDTHTFNIPSASASNRGLITTGTQTIAGAKTFNTSATFSTSTTNAITASTTSGTAVSGTSSNYIGLSGSSTSGKGLVATSSTGIGAEINSGSGVGLTVISQSNDIALFYGASSALKASISQAGNITANSFIKSGGTSSQFLKADGSVDSNTYALASSLSGYVPYTGATTNVDLGVYNITPAMVYISGAGTGGGGVLNLKKDTTRVVGGADAANTISVWADGATLGFNDWVSGNTRSAKFSVASITNNATRTYTLPNSDGTIALTSDLGAYLPLSGGTLTGALFGTTASFASSIGLTSASSSSSLTSTTNGIEISVDGSTTSNKNTIFKVGSSETMRINASGNLGIGVTPSAWDAYKAYQVGLGALASTGSTQNTLFSSNVYFDGATFKYIGSDTASYLQQFNGSFIWKTAPSGTAGNAISFTQAMTLNASGNLGIGTTSPVGKLHVSGSDGSELFRLDAGINTRFAYRINSGANDYLTLYRSHATVGNLDIMSFGYNGNVGIGTTSPSYPLHLKNGTFSQLYIEGGNAADLILYNSGGSANVRTMVYRQTATGEAKFYTANDNGTINVDNVLVLKNTGNVGIGTTSPAVNLQVTNTSGELFRLTNTTGGERLHFYTRNSTSNSRIGSQNSSLQLFSEDVGFDLLLGTSNTERMRITSGGQVQIKQGTNTFSDGLRIINSSSNYWGVVVGSDNNFYLGYNSPTNSIGNFNSSTGAYTATSDINKKKDFEESNIGLNAILGLEPTLYRMKNESDESAKHLGFIAQQVKEFVPQAYSESTNGNETFIGLTEMPIIAALVKGMQEQQQQIEELKALINK